MFYIPNNFKNKKYKEWLRKNPCAFCGQPPPSEPHHIRNIDMPTGAGQTPSDYLALPACRECHDKDQRYELLGPGCEDWDKSKKLLAIIFHLAHFLEEQRHGSK